MNQEKKLANKKKKSNQNQQKRPLNCPQKAGDKNFKSFFFSYLIKRRLIQQLDNHYHCRIVSLESYQKTDTLSDYSSSESRYKIVRKVHEDIQNAARARFSQLASLAYFFSFTVIIIHHKSEFYIWNKFIVVAAGASERQRRRRKANKKLNSYLISWIKLWR